MLKFIFRIISAVLSIIQMTIGVGTFAPSVKIESDNQPYPYVLVHGYVGWGFDEKLADTLPYWGSFNGDLAKYLNTTSVECYSASVGSFSSAWDRACELYAQLIGTTVDYGKAHSEKFGHERYGKTYSKPLFDGWSKTKKVNLIAHSFGGNTVRLLATLLANGSEAEIKATAENELSPLFKGGNSGMIYSITTLASPHNGTTLTDVVSLGKSDSIVLNGAYRLFALLGTSGEFNEIFDADFSQWNLSNENGKLNNENIKKLISTPDTGFYDLTLLGAAELNKQISIQSEIYYYSFAGCSTKKSPLSNHQISAKTAGAITANLMGKYTGKAINCDIEITEDWWENDGTVNTISALHPDTEPYKNYDEQNIQPGIWQVFPVLSLDHNAFAGGSGMSKADATELVDRTITQINVISSTY